jgi:hypothetical protein
MFDEEGGQLGRASVQQFSLSMKLRDACNPGEDVWVVAAWNKDFNGYMIESISAVC